MHSSRCLKYSWDVPFSELPSPDCPKCLLVPSSTNTWLIIIINAQPSAWYTAGAQGIFLQNEQLNEWILLSHLKLPVINKIEAYLIICRVVTSNIHSDRERGALQSCFSGAAWGAWEDLMATTQGWTSLGAWESREGVPKTPTVLAMQQTVCLICYWGSKWLLCYLMHIFLRGGHIPSGKQRRQVDWGRISGNHSYKRCCTFGLVDHDKLARWSFQGWFLGALFFASTLTCGFMMTGQLLGRWQLCDHPASFKANWLWQFWLKWKGLRSYLLS